MKNTTKPTMLDSNKRPENRIHLFDPVGLINDGYGRGYNNEGLKSYDHSLSKGSRFGVEDESDRLSADMSRTQVIAKGRRDMMEMVRDLPESFYDLSLKDIVDHKEIDPPEEKKKKSMTETSTDNNKREVKSRKKKSSKKVKKKMVKSNSVNSGGFLVRTSVFPSFLRAKKRNNSLRGATKSSIPSESDQSNGFTSNTTSSSSSSSGITTRSNSIKARHRNTFLRNLCFFYGKRIRGKT